MVFLNYITTEPTELTEKESKILASPKLRNAKIAQFLIDIQAHRVF